MVLFGLLNGILILKKMKRKDKFVIANFKMTLSLKSELEHWLNSFIKARSEAKLEKTALVLCPPSIYLDRFVEKIGPAEDLDFGLQNCFWMENGAFTGETSPTAAHLLGANYVILGHSERRKFLGETDEMVALKMKTALKSRLKPVLCIGEDYEQKKKELTMSVIMNQLKSCLSQVSRGMIEEVIICYEPVWAISSNKPDNVPMPTSNEIMEAKLLIRKFLIDNYSINSAQKVKIIYGGSVDSNNVEEVIIEPDMDGALVGSASLRPYDLIKIATVIDQQSGEKVRFKHMVRAK